MTVANSPVQLFIFGIFEHKWGTRKHIGDLKKYSWCIPVQKEIKPIIWGAAITPEPWNRQQCWFIFEDPNVRVARLSKPRDNDTQIKHSQTHEKHTMRWTSTQKGNCVLEHNIWSTRKTHSGASWTPICWDHVTTQFHRCYIPGQRGAKWYITWANIMVVFNPRKLSMKTNHTSTNHPQRHTEHYQELVNPRRFWVYEFRALWMWRNEPYGNRKESIRVRDLPWLYITIKLFWMCNLELYLNTDGKGWVHEMIVLSRNRTYFLRSNQVLTQRFPNSSTMLSASVHLAVRQTKFCYVMISKRWSGALRFVYASRNNDGTCDLDINCNGKFVKHSKMLSVQFVVL